jgi:hypothetical protein
MQRQSGGLHAAVEFERGLFAPLAVPHDTLEWMASERAQLEARMPASARRVVVSLRHLTEREFKEFADSETFSSQGDVELSGSSREMYRTIRDNLPRFPVYVVPRKAEIASIEASESVMIEGQKRDLDVEHKLLDPSNKMILLWSLIGIVKGARQPIIGFIAEERKDGLIYTVEPKLPSYREYIHGLGADEARQRQEGVKLAKSLVHVARACIKPRGACNDENICVRGDGKVFFRGSVFQATNTPQESMDFMLRNLSKSSLAFLEADGAFSPAAQGAFLETLSAEGMLNLDAIAPRADLSDLPPFARKLAEHYRSRGVSGIPKVFKEWVDAKRRDQMPGPMRAQRKSPGA